MQKIELNKEFFYVADNEFPIQYHPKYSTLKCYPQLGLFEREIGLLSEILIANKNSVFINIGLSHGGYIPIKIMPYINDINDIYVVEKNHIHLNYFQKNRETYDVLGKIKIVDNLDNIKRFIENKLQIIRFDNINNINELINYQLYQFLLFNPNCNKSIILAYNRLDLPTHKSYILTNSNLIIYVSNDLIEFFENTFKYYLDSNSLNYNNLINICIMVKNAGDGFRDILTQNLPYIDQYTVLDTGSTDNTISIIQDVFKNKKGKIYQEPFINFRDSRNRCLELAGQSCKYTIMLDDTYVLKGNVRELLELIRSDQFADSYNIFVNSWDNVYGSNRILKTDRKLKYIYLIHEIIQDKNNLVVQLPLDQLYIDDVMNDYMRERSRNRKQTDLTLLYQTLQEYPDVPRTYYYIARTYIELEMWDKVYENCMKRIEHPNGGYDEEITECWLICGNVTETKFKWDWVKCEEIYLNCYNHDPSRADALYSIGMHYININPQKAYDFLKKGFELDISKTATSNLRVNVYNKFIPEALTSLCYQLKDYKLGELASEKYLKHNNQDKTIVSYHKIFQLLNKNNKNITRQTFEKEILCFVADGGFKLWSGSSINVEGVGGSETYIIELSRHLALLTNYEVYVFCNTPTSEGETFENVKYRKLTDYISFLNNHQVKISIISRFSEYVPVTLENGVDKVYLVLHDLLPSGIIIPLDNRLTILSMTEWHKKYFLNIFPMMESRTFVFPNGINVARYPSNPIKKKHSFIYSSFPNRGLIHLLKMFPKIREKIPDATLNVFCDTKNSWARSVANEDMDKIEKLLEEQKDYVTNHGWVPKNILTKWLLESEVWIYPCTFAETFCVTALEVAMSSVLAVTNDLAALGEVVGDRGIIIPGNANDENWQNKVISEIVSVLNDQNKIDGLLKKNREWAEKYDWKDLANVFVQKYIGKGKEVKYKYWKSIEENIEYLCGRFSHCRKVLEVGPGNVPFPLSTHFVDHMPSNLPNLTIIDITKEKLPFPDNEFDLVYCRHTLEDIHNPEFIFSELSRVAQIVYIETPSPLAETSRYIDASSPYYRGYIHHRYLIYNDDDTLTFIPKFPIIEHINMPDYQNKLVNKYYWNTYFIWNKVNGKPKIKIFQYDVDYNIHTDYDKIINIAIEKSTKSIEQYEQTINLTKNKLDYGGMYNWTNDLPIGEKIVFEGILNGFKNKGAKILEIGTYAGTSIIGMLKYLPDAQAVVIDMWEDYDEDPLLLSVKKNEIETIFYNNLKISNMTDRVKAIKGDSKDVLMRLIQDGNTFDFIYVDGSHKCLDCYSDMIMSWKLLNVGGILGVDDYLWETEHNREQLDLPYYAINHFMERYKGKYDVVNIKYRVFLRKL